MKSHRVKCLAVAVFILALTSCRKEESTAASQASGSTSRAVEGLPAFIRCGAEQREGWTITGSGPATVRVPVPRGSTSIDLAVCTDQPGAPITALFDTPEPAARKTSGWRAAVSVGVPFNSWGKGTVALTPAASDGSLTVRVDRGPDAAAKLFVSARARRKAPNGRPNILLISIDTLRADRLSTYGYPVQTSLNLDGLSRNGVAFNHAIAQATSTPPSHASMLTGLYPSRTGLFISEEVSSTIEKPGFRVKPEVWTLAEILRADGYHTLAATGGGFVSPRFGFGDGFDVFYADTFTRPDDLLRVSDRVASWIAEPDAPWFIFLHTYTVHAAQSGYEHRSYEFLPTFDKTYARPDAVAKHYNARYDSGVLYADAILGRIFSMLYFAHQIDGTIVIVTSDHGETMEERIDQAGYKYNHGYAFYEELVRVPLVIQAPKLLPRDVRVDRPVELVDLVPTLLELTGIRHPEGKLDGRSLVSLAKGSGGYDKDVAFIESSPGGPFRVAVRDGRYKYVRVLDWKPSFGKEYGMTRPPEEELYDLARDPGERRNLAGRPGMAVEQKRLRQRLETLVARSGTRSLIPTKSP